MYLFPKYIDGLNKTKPKKSNIFLCLYNTRVSFTYNLEENYSEQGNTNILLEHDLLKFVHRFCMSLFPSVLT